MNSASHECFKEFEGFADVEKDRRIILLGFAVGFWGFAVYGANQYVKSTSRRSFRSGEGDRTGQEVGGGGVDSSDPDVDVDLNVDPDIEGVVWSQT